MGCCLFTSLLAGAPRIAFLIWWLLEPRRVGAAFGSWVWTVLGVAFVPWTTIAFVAVSPAGVRGLDWLWLGLGLVADISTYAGGGAANRRRPVSASAASRTNRMT